MLRHPPFFGLPRSAGSSALPQPGEQHPRDMQRSWWEPADLRGHRQVVAYGVMLSDGISDDCEPVQIMNCSRTRCSAMSVETMMGAVVMIDLLPKIELTISQLI
jgi:hypothetical protein